KLAANRDPLLLTGWQQLLGGFVLLVPGLAGGGQIALKRPAALLALAFLSVSVALVYILWMMLLKHNPVSEIAVFKFGVPVVGMLTSSLILHEQILAWNSLLALLLVSAGIVVVNARMRRSRSPGP
ncbi:MAG: EamA family transporter, partial [Clostridiaceae bacterium]|nr:EamA family transporter [Clostridiaceae bacterium]